MDPWRLNISFVIVLLLQCSQARASETAMESAVQPKEILPALVLSANQGFQNNWTRGEPQIGVPTGAGEREQEDIKTKLSLLQEHSDQTSQIKKIISRVQITCSMFLSYIAKGTRITRAVLTLQRNGHVREAAPENAKKSEGSKKIKELESSERELRRINKNRVHNSHELVSHKNRRYQQNTSKRRLLYSSLNGFNTKSSGRISWVGRIGIILGPNLNELSGLKSQWTGGHEGEWEGEEVALDEKDKQKSKAKSEGEWEGDFLGIFDEEGGIDEGDEKEKDYEGDEPASQALPLDAQRNDNENASKDIKP